VSYMLSDITGSLRAFLFPRGTCRYYFASIVAHAFREPGAIPSIFRSLPHRKQLYGRSKPGLGVPLLFIDDVLPDPRVGSGAPRTSEILRILISNNFNITFFSLIRYKTINPSLEYYNKTGVEFFFGTHPSNSPILTRFLKKRRNYYEAVIISRPTNMRDLYKIIRKTQRHAAIIYDAEAIFAYRNISYQKLIGKPFSFQEIQRRLKNEIELAKKANSVLAVSEKEATMFRENGCERVYVVRHVVESSDIFLSGNDRNGILFIGPVLDTTSPNEDAILYFIKEILPLIRLKIDACFTIVGQILSKNILCCQSDLVKIVGAIDNLSPYYTQSKIFVAPTRYGAGIPIKVLNAAAHGLPAVVTPLLCDQLGWKNEKEVLTGDTAEAFAHACIRLCTDPKLWLYLQKSAYERVTKECDSKTFSKNVLNAISPLKYANEI
jgi:O-antigen biosynthesis protein